MTPAADPLKPGTRVELLSMGEDPDPIPPGTRGTVRYHHDPGGVLEQVAVDWDIPRSLALVPRVDRFRVLDDHDRPPLELDLGPRFL